MHVGRNTMTFNILEYEDRNYKIKEKASTERIKQMRNDALKLLENPDRLVSEWVDLTLLVMEAGKILEQ